MKNFGWSPVFVIVIAAMVLSLSPLHAEVTADDPAAIQVTEEQKSAGLSVYVYYFHGTRRCKTCLAIETKAKKAIEEAFPAELAQGSITWQSVNTDLEENRHFEKEFDLMFSSLILVKYKDGKQVEWKNLQRVWELVWDETALDEYVRKETKAYLES
ncbi:hypothetical protein JXA40_10370 [bacterium]|nr:hypothetical protein [candidate division CSSED10-310 bacterium]